MSDSEIKCPVCERLGIQIGQREEKEKVFWFIGKDGKNIKLDLSCLVCSGCHEIFFDKEATEKILYNLLPKKIETKHSESFYKDSQFFLAFVKESEQEVVALNIEGYIENNCFTVFRNFGHNKDVPFPAEINLFPLESLLNCFSMLKDSLGFWDTSLIGAIDKLKTYFFNRWIESSDIEERKYFSSIVQVATKLMRSVREQNEEGVFTIKTSCAFGDTPTEESLKDKSNELDSVEIPFAEDVYLSSKKNQGKEKTILIREINEAIKNAADVGKSETKYSFRIKLSDEMLNELRLAYEEKGFQVSFPDRDLNKPTICVSWESANK